MDIAVILQIEVTFLFMNRLKRNNHPMLRGTNRYATFKSVKLFLRVACTNLQVNRNRDIRSKIKKKHCFIYCFHNGHYERNRLTYNGFSYKSLMYRQPSNTNLLYIHILINYIQTHDNWSCWYCWLHYYFSCTEIKCTTFLLGCQDHQLIDLKIV